MHLIGIDENVAGRFSENFVNKNARIALLRYLNNKSLNETVVYLLMRDPWLSDIPQLMKYLSDPNKDYSKVLSALQRYEFAARPLGQKIDSDIMERKITVVYPAPYYGEKPTDPIYDLISYQKELKQRILVDNEISRSSKWARCKVELTRIKTVKLPNSFGFSFSFFIGDVFNFCGFQSSFFYTFNNHKIIIYGPIKAKHIWLDWWNKLADKEKKAFYSYVHPSFNERFNN